jgi:hypothetical protein
MTARVLCQAMLMLAGGGEGRADIEHSAGPSRAIRVGAVGLDAVPHVPPVDTTTS